MNTNQRRARLFMFLGAALLAAAAAIAIWDLGGSDAPDGPAPVTGEVDPDP